jgi:hypothetical protein
LQEPGTVVAAGRQVRHTALAETAVQARVPQTAAVVVALAVLAVLAELLLREAAARGGRVTSQHHQPPE